MLAKVYSTALYGVDAYEVEIEVNAAAGAPVIVVGLPDAAVKESRDRVTTAVANSPSPGKVTLAHNGVLFMDELPEFKRSTLEDQPPVWPRFSGGLAVTVPCLMGTGILLP